MRAKLATGLLVLSPTLLVIVLLAFLQGIVAKEMGKYFPHTDLVLDLTTRQQIVLTWVAVVAAFVAVVLLLGQRRLLALAAAWALLGLMWSPAFYGPATETWWIIAAAALVASLLTDDMLWMLIYALGLLVVFIVGVVAGVVIGLWWIIKGLLWTLAVILVLLVIVLGLLYDLLWEILLPARAICKWATKTDARRREVKIALIMIFWLFVIIVIVESFT